MKLIGMTDFVITQWSINLTSKQICLIKNYENFLKQPLELWMFFPCDLIQGKVVILDKEDKYYQQAKERCLFKGIYLCDDGFIRDEYDCILFTKESMAKQTIQDMIYHETNLTKTAEKLIGL